MSQKIPVHDIVLLEEVGKGSVGAVWKAQWCGSIVAVKKISLTGITAEEQEVISKEIDATGSTNHENICKIYGQCNTGTEIWIIMALVNGVSLYNLLHSQKDIPWTQRLQIAKQVATAVHALHTLPTPVLHKEIKSPNFLVGEGTNVVFMTDFGLAQTKKIYQLHNSSSTAVYRWSAPETVGRAGKFTEKSDIFSLGVVFFEIAAREIPYKNETGYDVVEAIKENVRPDIPDSCPKEFADIIRKCWDQDPEKRPTSSDVLSLLQNVIIPGQLAQTTNVAAHAPVSVPTNLVPDQYLQYGAQYPAPHYPPHHGGHHVPLHHAPPHHGGHHAPPHQYAPHHGQYPPAAYPYATQYQPGAYPPAHPGAYPPGYQPAPINPTLAENPHTQVTTQTAPSTQTTPNQTSPGQITPGQITPGQITPGQITPGQITPGQITPGQITPGQTTSAQPTPPSNVPTTNQAPMDATAQQHAQVSASQHTQAPALQHAQAPAPYDPYNPHQQYNAYAAPPHNAAYPPYYAPPAHGGTHGHHGHHGHHHGHHGHHGGHQHNAYQYPPPYGAQYAPAPYGAPPQYAPPPTYYGSAPFNPNSDPTQQPSAPPPTAPSTN